MRVRDWQDILEDVVESDADPGGWRAVAGDRRGGPGEDMFLEDVLPVADAHALNSVSGRNEAVGFVIPRPWDR